MSKVYISSETNVSTNDSTNVSTNVSTNDSTTDFTPDFVHIQVDYLGNIYIKHGSDYYTVSLDAYLPAGIELNKISKLDIFRKNHSEYQFLKKEIKSGVIKPSETTLTGKAHELMNQMTEEEYADYMEKNNYSNYDSTFEEKQHYRIDLKEEDDDTLEGIINDNFYLHGVVDDNESTQGIIYSDLLSFNPGSFDVILINGEKSSNNVLSVIERVDGYYTARLTIYTKGIFKANFMDKQILAKLVKKSSNEESDELFLNMVPYNYISKPESSDSISDLVQESG
jgi:hypothetical protein